jgi:MFS family permease
MMGTPGSSGGVTSSTKEEIMETTTQPPGAPSKPPHLLINRNYGFLWIGQSISLFGDEIFDFTLLIWFAAILTRRPDGTSEPWAPLAVSGILIATTVPFFLVGPLAGVFVDRWDKRRTMLWMDALRALLIACSLLAANIIPFPFFPGGALPLPGRLGLVYAVVFLTSACSRFFAPARLALIGDLVEESERPRASALAQGSAAGALVVGPLLAAPLLVALGVQWALIIDALSFVCSFLGIALVRAPEAARSVARGEQGHMGRELVAGFRFTFTNRILSTLLITLCLSTLGFGAVHALYVFFTIDNLHAIVSAVGLVGALFGAGGIAGAILWGATAERVGVARLFCASVSGFGLALLVEARLTSLVPGLVLFFLIGVVQSGLQVSFGPLVLAAAPREMIGRVMAIIDPAERLTELISVGIAGSLASTVLLGFRGTFLGLSFGPYDTLFLGSGTLMLLGGVFATMRLRGVKESHVQDPPPGSTEEPLSVASARADQ